MTSVTWLQTNANGLEEAAGDIKLSYAANGLSASYEMSDTGNDAYYMRAGYTGRGLDCRY
jgi:hypothetical protein